MRRTLLPIALLAGLLVCTSSAFAAKAGFNLPTKRLEGAYKFALQDRRFDPNGCYPAPNTLAKSLSKDTGRRVGVAQNTNGLGHLNQVYVLRSGTNCDQLRMALRAVGGIYVLDTRQGTVRIQGHKGSATPGLARTLRSLVLVTANSRLTKPDEVDRGEAICPGGRYPVGGGNTVSPPTAADGEGIYPHSFERLGAQRGFHISVVLLDPSRGSTTPRTLTTQALCGFGVIPATPTPHKTIFIRPGQTKTVTARCPSGQFLVSGGFQRTDFRSDGGDYITESKALGTKAWTVTGHAYGSGPGELTSIAYCARMGKPKLTEVVSSPAPVAAGQSAATTTPACPAGHRMVTGGFSTGGSTDSLFVAGTLNDNNTFSATNHGFFGPTPQLTAYGYCWPARS
ncbi:MAG: hypothetical protein ACJ75Z_05460 [Solirubrobacterales bacterium]